MPPAFVALAAGVLALGGMLLSGGAAHADDTTYEVSGTLTGLPTPASDPVALSGVAVWVVDSEANYYGGVTDANGAFDISFTPASADPNSADTSYAMLYNCGTASDATCNLDYTREWSGHAYDRTDATQFPLTTDAPSATQDFQLQGAASISGVVKDAVGTPLAGAHVTVHAPNATAGESDTTDSDGRYTLRQVRPSDTIAQASYSADPDAQGRQDFYRTQYWDHSATPAGATALTLTAGALTSDVDFDLVQAPAIRGRVVDAAGNGLPDVACYPMHWDAVAGTWLAPTSGAFDTDASGYFTWNASGSSSWKFSFADLLGADDGHPQNRTPYQSAWYSNASSFDTAQAIDIAGQSTQVDLGDIVLDEQSSPINLVGSPVISTGPGNDGGVILNGVAVSPGDTALALQWLRDGVPIDGATSGTYHPTTDDQGTVLTVRLDATRAGFDPQTFTSQPLDLRSTFTATPTPTVSGTTTVGATLNVDPGPWVPTPDSFTYRWSRNGVAISGATASTYLLAPSDAGATITVSVTGTKTGYLDFTQSSAPTDPIAPGALVTGTPTISGSPTYGQPLTANPGNWGPGTVTFAYQWISGTTDIAGANASTYTPVLADLGANLSVRVSGSESGYVTAAATSVQTAEVRTAAFSAAPTPTISGTVAVGQTVTANPGAWAPGSPTFTYQWLSEGTPIVGATSPTYAILAADQGNRLSVVVTASAPGYSDSAKTSTSTPAVAFGTLTPGVPSVTPTSPTFPQTLTASTGVWSPTPDGFSYQWQRNGADISGATSATYALVPADVNQKISVKVTGSKAGYTNVTPTSLQTEPVVPGSLTPGTPILAGNYVFQSTLTVSSPGTWSPSGVTFAYQWLRNGNPISGATASTYTLQAADVGATVTARVTGSLPGYTSAASTATGQSVQPKTFDASVTPTLSNPSSTRHQLTASISGWVPTPDTWVFSWLRDGAAVSVADPSSNKYTLTSDDFNHTISVVATGVKSGYASVTTSASNAVGPIEAFLPKFTPTGVPSISGDTAVGEKLSASTGSWDPAPTSYLYVWQRGTGDTLVPIQGANSSTYTLTPDDFGKSIVVRVTAQKTGYDPTGPAQASVATDPVDAGTLVTSKPVITGTAQYGSTLTADPQTWTPQPTFGYQWLRGGAVIQGATSKTYVLQVADIGQAVSVRVTGSTPGYDTNVQDSSATSLVSLGTFSATPAPTIQGSAQVGRVLATIDPTFVPATGFSYQWLRNGSPIVGAIGSNYAVTADDQGAMLSVRVSSTLPGYVVTSATSEPTASVIEGVFTTVPKPTISGTARVGSTLTANPGPWFPAITDFSYAWKTGSTLLGTGATYVPTSGLIGKTITVTVTSDAEGFAAKSSSPSSATAKVVAGKLSGPTPTVSGTARVGQVLTTAGGTGWSPSTAKISYAWLRSGKAISGATKSTYTATTSDYKKTISVRITASLSGYTTVSKTSKTVTIAAGTLATSTPTISGVNDQGQPVIGTKLTVARGTWGPGTVSFTYQWYASGTAISGATKSTYTPTSGRIGKTISVKVTGKKTDYTTVSKTSASTAAVIAAV